MAVDSVARPLPALVLIVNGVGHLSAPSSGLEVRLWAINVAADLEMVVVDLLFYLVLKMRFPADVCLFCFALFLFIFFSPKRVLDDWSIYTRIMY